MAERRVDLVLAASTGGIGTHVRSLAAGLVARGASVTVIGPASTEELFGFRAVGAEFKAVQLNARVPLLGDVSSARRLRKRLTGDVVHAHGLRAGLLAAIALGTRRQPLVTTWHNALLHSGPQAKAWHAAARFVADRSAVTLGASADLVAEDRRLGARDARLGPVAAPALAPQIRSRDEVREELGCLDRALAVCVARLHPQKGLLNLVTATSGWQGPPLTIVVAGEGPQRAELQAAISRSGAPVRLLGHRADTADLLRAADVAVISSVWEARALVAQEAMLAHTPLVTTSVGGIPELVGDAALLVPPGEPRALGAALHRVLADPALAAELRRRGTAQAAEWPGEADVVTLVERVYDDVLGARS
jgi:glycosyltransferase involved in cell wall biosynthesis